MTEKLTQATPARRIIDALEGLVDFKIPDPLEEGSDEEKRERKDLIQTLSRANMLQAWVWMADEREVVYEEDNHDYREWQDEVIRLILDYEEFVASKPDLVEEGTHGGVISALKEAMYDNAYPGNARTTFVGVLSRPTMSVLPVLGMADQVLKVYWKEIDNLEEYLEELLCEVNENIARIRSLEGDRYLMNLVLDALEYLRYIVENYDKFGIKHLKNALGNGLFALFVSEQIVRDKDSEVSGIVERIKDVLVKACLKTIPSYYQMSTEALVHQALDALSSPQTDIKE